jgi:UDP-glucose 4-epimerase
VNGDGEQTHDFTTSTTSPEPTSPRHPSRAVSPGAVYNLGGDSRVIVNVVTRVLETLTGRVAHMRYEAIQPGDARHTFADCSAARCDLGFEPRFSLPDGLRAHVAWTEGLHRD